MFMLANDTGYSKEYIFSIKVIKKQYSGSENHSVKVPSIGGWECALVLPNFENSLKISLNTLNPFKKCIFGKTNIKKQYSGVQSH